MQNTHNRNHRAHPPRCDKRYDLGMDCAIIMTTLGQGNTFHISDPLWGEPPVTGGSPNKEPVCFPFYVSLHKLKNK